MIGIAVARPLVFALLSVSLTGSPGAADNLDLSQGHWVDLTHAFSEQTIYWPTASEFEHETVFEGVTEKGFYYSAYNFSAAEHGRLPNGCIVLLNTGSSQWWPDKKQYMGTDLRGEEAVRKLHFPGLDPETAEWLVENRAIKAIGLDTPSIDFGQSTHFESHRILFDRNIPALENVANLDQLPPTGAVLFALPMKIAGGSGGPTRVVAFLSK